MNNENEKVVAYSNEPNEREHVTTWIRECGKYKIGEMVNNQNHAYMRWTVDQPEDLIVVRNIEALILKLE